MPPDTAEIDILWEDDEALSGIPPSGPRPREMMPTMLEEDPLQYDIVYRHDRDPTRDSLPTIPDFDPLRHDLEA